MANYKYPSIVKPYLQVTEMTLDQYAFGNVPITNKYSSSTSNVLKIESLIITNSFTHDIGIDITFTNTGMNRLFAFHTQISKQTSQVLVSADAPLYLYGDQNLFMSCSAKVPSGTSLNYATPNCSAIVNGVEIHE